MSNILSHAMVELDRIGMTGDPETDICEVWDYWGTRDICEVWDYWGTRDICEVWDYWGTRVLKAPTKSAKNMLPIMKELKNENNVCCGWGICCASGCARHIERW